MQYCYVQNNIPGPPQELPQNWGNVSNFYLLSPQALAAKGWYPFIPATPPTFNESTQKRVESRIFTGSAVNQTWQVVNLTTQEQIDFATARLTAISEAITPFLNATYARRSYLDFTSARTIATSSNPTWAQEGREAIAYYDLIWNAFMKLQADVISGAVPLPTIEGWLASQPVLWPPPPSPPNNNGTANGPI